MIVQKQTQERVLVDAFGDSRSLPKVVVVVITIQIARLWLQLNHNFRPLRQLIVKKYARDMKANKWDVNGESIKFDQDGNLIDGQHRLAACIEANMPFTTVVVYNANARNVDTGWNRQLGQYLQAQNEISTYVLAAAVRLIYAQEHGALYSISRLPATNEEVLETLSRHPQVRESIAPSQKARTLAHVSALTFLHYAFRREAGDEKVKEFFDSLVSGINLDRNNPIYNLRQALIKNSLSKSKMTRLTVMQLIIKAWNYWLKGSPLKILAIRKEGNAAEILPRLNWQA